MIHKFVLGRCVQCSIPQEDLERVGWECTGHSASASDIAAISEVPATQTTDIFAILTFATGMLGFWILPIIFTPICYICAIISYFRLKENPNLKGKGLRIIGAILGALSLLYMFYQFGFFG